MSKIWLYMPADYWERDNMMQKEPDLFSEIGIQIEGVLQPSTASRFAKRIGRDDLLIISGHGSHDYSKQLFTAYTPTEIRDVIGTLKKAGLGLDHRAVLSVACEAAGTTAVLNHNKVYEYNNYGMKLTQTHNLLVLNEVNSAPPNYELDNNPYFRRNSDGSTTRMGIPTHPHEVGKHLPIAGEMAKEFGKAGYKSICVGGFPGRLMYGRDTYRDDLGKPWPGWEHPNPNDDDDLDVIPVVYLKSVSKTEHSVKIFPHIDHIRWYDAYGKLIKPDRFSTRFEPKVFSRWQLWRYKKKLGPTLEAKLKRHKQHVQIQKTRLKHPSHRMKGFNRRPLPYSQDNQ